jgi:hypothetical protein
MNDELDEALSAWLDGEVPPHDVLRRALAQPHALATLDELLVLRAALHTELAPSTGAIAATRAAMGSTRRVRRHLTPQLRWALAALVLLIIGATIGMALSRRERVIESGSRPPVADLVAPFPLDGPRG